MEAMGVFNSCVTALMKLSCCSLRRTSRTRKIVLSTIPAIIAPKKMTPRKTLIPSRQLRMIHPLPTAPARPARHTPRVTKIAIARRRLEIRIRVQQNSTTPHPNLPMGVPQKQKPRPQGPGFREEFRESNGSQFLRRREPFAFTSRFLLALEFGKLQPVHILGQSQFAERPDPVPVHIHFVPLQAMPARHRMRVMIVVPPLAEGKDRDPPVVGREILGFKAP